MRKLQLRDILQLFSLPKVGLKSRSFPGQGTCSKSYAMLTPMATTGILKKIALETDTQTEHLKN